MNRLLTLPAGMPAADKQRGDVLLQLWRSLNHP